MCNTYLFVYLLFKITKLREYKRETGKKEKDKETNEAAQKCVSEVS